MRSFWGISNSGHLRSLAKSATSPSHPNLVMCDVAGSPKSGDVAGLDESCEFVGWLVHGGKPFKPGDIAR